ncbi:MAG TPA: acetyl-CoA carboxylase biotin carboxylase subunit, partial [Acidimicrobiia bacterium]|nr:acetyl-CoA carboxylase biotin carboxylase subunit [Acidimicrobiia bacterium]
TQLAVAGGAALPAFDPAPQGHAIECRITAESAAHGFRPVPGHIDDWDAPQGDGIRVDTHCFPGADVPPYYDSLLAKLVVHGADRHDAADRMAAALGRFVVRGVATTIDLHRFVLDHPDYRADRVHTGWVEGRALPDFLQAR